MWNLVEKYTAEETIDTDDGVVAIEYVLVAAAIVAALAVIFVAFGDELNDRLQTVIDSI
jgi:Flp pilus assembly pilin Flp